MLNLKSGAKTPLAAALAAVLALSATSADAAIMVMTRTLQIMGVSDSSIENLVDTNLVLRVSYDTDLGLTEDTRSPEFGGNYSLSNNGGTVTPLLSASYTLGGETFDALSSGAAFITFFNYQPGGETQHFVSFAGNVDGRVFDISLGGILAEGQTLPADFTQALQRDVQGYGQFNFDHGARRGSLFFNDEAFTPVGDLTITRSDVAAVPEPATWALMIGGFGLAGATLRRRRAAFA